MEMVMIYEKQATYLREQLPKSKKKEVRESNV